MVRIRFSSILGLYFAAAIADSARNLVHPVSAFSVRLVVNPSSASRRIRSQRSNEWRPLKDSNGDKNAEADAWLDQAARLREQVQELEAEARQRTKTTATTSTTDSANNAPIMVNTIDDSVWTVSYRFSNQPETIDEDVKENDNTRRRFWSGKLTLRFRPDGYTDLISQECSGSISDSCRIVKAWGWDMELAEGEEDRGKGEDKEFLLFSIDVELPVAATVDTNDTQTSASSSPETVVQRFYFQARQDKASNGGALSLAEGTVTIKQDLVKNNSARRWGLFFSPAGILAQFRFVGEFVAKPAALNSSSGTGG